MLYLNINLIKWSSVKDPRGFAPLWLAPRLRGLRCRRSFISANRLGSMRNTLGRGTINSLQIAFIELTPA